MDFSQNRIVERMNKHIWKSEAPLELESGAYISPFQLAYHTWGEINENQSNVVWVFHALTANSDPSDWWPGVVGKDCVINPDEHYIICVNTIGSPYGSSAPSDLSFPEFTVRDVVKSQLLLAEHLGITRIQLAIGGSFGGSQALEFTYSFTGQIDKLVLVACAARESAWGIAIHQAQRLALQADATFGQPDGGKLGLKAARGIGLLTYRTPEAFQQTQSNPDDRIANHKAASYIDYQGDKLVSRFSSLSYYYLHKCLDTHHIGRDRGGVETALSTIQTPTVVIGINSDQLLPTSLQKIIFQGLPNARYVEIQSEFGHDGFLVEAKQVVRVLRGERF